MFTIKSKSTVSPKPKDLFSDSVAPLIGAQESLDSPVEADSSGVENDLTQAAAAAAPSAPSTPLKSGARLRSTPISSKRPMVGYSEPAPSVAEEGEDNQSSNQLDDPENDSAGGRASRAPQNISSSAFLLLVIAALLMMMCIMAVAVVFKRNNDPFVLDTKYGSVEVTNSWQDAVIKYNVSGVDCLSGDVMTMYARLLQFEPTRIDDWVLLSSDNMHKCNDLYERVSFNHRLINFMRKEDMSMADRQYIRDIDDAWHGLGYALSESGSEHVKRIRIDILKNAFTQYLLRNSK